MIILDQEGALLPCDMLHEESRGGRMKSGPGVKPVIWCGVLYHYGCTQ